MYNSINDISKRKETKHGGMKSELFISAIIFNAADSK
jgi:hypothetical protein